MDTNMTFRMDSQTKTRMTEICAQLGMTTSTAFNIFANAFVRAQWYAICCKIGFSILHGNTCTNAVRCR